MSSKAGSHVSWRPWLCSCMCDTVVKNVSTWNHDNTAIHDLHQLTAGITEQGGSRNRSGTGVRGRWERGLVCVLGENLPVRWTGAAEATGMWPQAEIISITEDCSSVNTLRKTEKETPKRLQSFQNKSWMPKIGHWSSTKSRVYV